MIELNGISMIIAFEFSINTLQWASRMSAVAHMFDQGSVFDAPWSIEALHLLRLLQSQ